MISPNLTTNREEFNMLKNWAFGLLDSHDDLGGFYSQGNYLAMAQALDAKYRAAIRCNDSRLYDLQDLMTDMEAMYKCAYLAAVCAAYADAECTYVVNV